MPIEEATREDKDPTTSTPNITVQPGLATLLDWPVRCGKTYNVIHWIAANQGKKFIILAPTWGTPGEPDTGVAANIIQELEDAGIDDYRLAAGKARACPEWADDNETTNDILGYQRKEQRHCTGCEHLRSVSDIDEAPDLPPCKGPFPQRRVYDAESCPKWQGIWNLYNPEPGRPVITTPTTFQHAVAKLGRDEDYDIHDWADDLVIIWDEMHKDKLLLQRASTTSPFEVDIEDFETNQPSLPDFLDTIPPCCIDAIQDDDTSRDEAEDQLTLFQTRLKESLQIIAAYAWHRYLGLTLPYTQVQRHIDRIQRWADQGKNATQIASITKHSLNNQPRLELFAEWETYLEDILIPHLEAHGDQPLEEGWEIPIEEDHPGLRQATDPTYHDIEAYTSFLRDPDLDALPSWAAASNNPWEAAMQRISHWTSTMRNILSHLATPRGDIPLEAMSWVSLLKTLTQTPNGLLWLDYQPTASKELHKAHISASVLEGHLSLHDDETGPIHRSYAGLADALEAGASTILMSATPPPIEDIERYLNGREVRRVPYPADRPRPKLSTAFEDCTRSIHNTIAFDEGADVKLQNKPEQLIGESLNRIEQPCYLVARNTNEYDALEPLANQETVERRYFRDAQSLGVSWNAEDWSPDAGEVIIAMGPPYLPPTVWPALEGLTYRDQDPVEASKAYRDERMAMEYLQTMARNAQVPIGNQEDIMGKGALLAGKHAKETLQNYAIKWGIDIEWVPVPTYSGMSQRARMLVAAFEWGTKPISDYADKLLRGWPFQIFSKKEILEEWRWSPNTLRKRFAELSSREFIEQTYKGGENGREEFYQFTRKANNIYLNSETNFIGSY